MRSCLSLLPAVFLAGLSGMAGAAPNPACFDRAPEGAGVYVVTVADAGAGVAIDIAPGASPVYLILGSGSPAFWTLRGSTSRVVRVHVADAFHGSEGPPPPSNPDRGPIGDSDPAALEPLPVEPVPVSGVDPGLVRLRGCLGFVSGAGGSISLNPESAIRLAGINPNAFASFWRARVVRVPSMEREE